MARLVLISPYLKGGRQAPRLANLTRYIATRDGMEKLPENSWDRPATEEQRGHIRRLLRAFPAAGERLPAALAPDQPCDAGGCFSAPPAWPASF